jgi:hypothetical protein
MRRTGYSNGHTVAVAMTAQVMAQEGEKEGEFVEHLWVLRITPAPIVRLCAIVKVLNFNPFAEPTCSRPKTFGAFTTPSGCDPPS